jgi:hypothetical protein
MSRNSMPIRDILMNPSAALLAAKREEPSVVTSADIDLADKCIPPYVLTVAKNVKFLLSLEKAGQYIVVSVTAR